MKERIQIITYSGTEKNFKDIMEFFTGVFI